MLKNVVKEYIYQNRKIVIGLLICILIGVLSGFTIYNFSSDDIKGKLVDQLSDSIRVSGEGEFVRKDVIYSGIKNNIVIIIAMFLFSIMLYGTLLIYLIYIIKGIALGVYIGTLFGMFGFWWGLLAIILLVILVNIVYIPSLIFIGTTFINYNLNVLEYRGEINKVQSLSNVFVKVLFGVMIVFSSIIVEQLTSNIVIKISDYLGK